MLLTTSSHGRHTVVTVSEDTSNVELRTHLYIYDAAVPGGSEWATESGSWRVVLARKGGLYWLGASQTLDVNVGDVLVIGPFSEGVLRASRIGESELSYFYFAPEHLAGLMSVAERLSLETLPWNRTAHLIPATDRVGTEYQALVAEDTHRRSFVDRCHILHLIAMIFRDAMPARRGPVNSFITSQIRFEQVIERIPDAELMNYPSEKLAELCGCSARHFRRLFRAHFRTSIRAKQTELRLEKARQLLADTDEKIGSIATESGYRHIGFFNAAFKRKFGVTPSEWRRNNARTAFAGK
jgi:AraC-like DNA-binding protein